MLFKQTDEHADLVFKLRSLLDKANEINLQNTVKLIKSSRALQIIQSRLAYKQQLYTEALLKSNSVNNLNMPESVSGYELLSNKLEAPSGSNYLSEDDNESFVSADSVSGNPIDLSSICTCFVMPLLFLI